jgi:hypothetical protein
MAPRYTASNIFTGGVAGLSWLSLLAYPKESIRKYLPVTIFALLLVSITHTLAATFKWWVNKGGVKIRVFQEFCFIFGPYLAGTLWIFHFTFGKLGRYLLVNLMLDSALAYGLKIVFPFFKVFKFGNFKPKYIFQMAIVSSLLLYAFQKFIIKQKKRG